ncbi:AT-rich interactive domain-containing protein 2 [Pseudolycoriella hygida]|uniref:AT-rich interactive domain-containing protein 2 n=1 Tax=Pseudolycoriella hygida TaxID=35572 RepID=A0A9Q0MI87_9DIPT|nr:AT-rich interactive domain-containing protein 2 [Pseudolycoriella hygida]
MDSSQGNTSTASLNEDSFCSFKQSTTKKNEKNLAGVSQSANRGDDHGSFYKELYHFHENKGTPIPRVPKINGHEIDLHKFYNLVISRGGWAKINYRNEWEELVPEFNLPKKCVNASVALKQIYLRYLDRFEKVHFLGEDSERVDDADDDNRHKKWNNKVINEVPLKYNYSQHAVPDGLRIIHKLSTDLYKASEYERLIMSLMSPLPNEQDFAINVCTLMANESKHTLKIENSPKLLEVLLSHAGVYSHFTLRVIFIEFYSKIRRHSLQAFWSDCLRDKPEILELSYEDYFQSPDEKLENGIPELPLNRKRNDQRESFEDGLIDADDEEEDGETTKSLDFLNLGRGLGTHDYIGQRVHQIASILRNLSFIEENFTTLVRNRSFIRFLVMTANIRWGNLHHIGLDILGNVAAEIELSDPSSDDLTRCLLSTVCDGLEGQDRGVVISCLEILYKLCQKDNNEDHLHRCLDKKIYRQICLFLALNDIMLLMYTLECIYALSSLGEKSCQAIAHVNGVIDTLVSLVTVEAQSYGPDGCILMRVVETVPSNMPAPSPNVAPSSSTNATSNPPTQSTSSTQQDIKEPVATLTTVTSNEPQVSAPVQQQAVILQPPNIIRPPAPASAVVTPTPTPPPSNNNQTPIKTEAIKVEPSPVPTTQMSLKQAQQQVVQENEQFALAWLRATFEPVMALTSRIEQSDLYKMYNTASSKIGRQSVVSLAHFPRCVRMVFGGTVGPNKVKINNVDTMCYEGIRIRAKPLAVQGQVTNEVVIKKQEPVTTIKQSANQIQVQNQQPNTNQHGSILVAQLNNKTQQSQQQPIQQQQQTMQQQTIQQQQPMQQQQQFNQSSQILQQVLSNQTGESLMVVTNKSNSNLIIQQQQVNTTNVVNSQTMVSTSSSSLIKSLLANKVTTQDNAASNITSCLIAPNVNVHQQVAQRQHLQKQKEIAQQIAVSSTVTSIINTHNQNSNLTIKSPTMKTIATSAILPASMIKKDVDSETANWDPVPPLAPLSGMHGTIRTVIPNIIPKDEDSDSTGNVSIASSIISTNPNTPIIEDPENSFTSFEGLLMPNSKINLTDDDSKDSLNKQTSPSLVVSSNKMLADLLERKSLEPPYNISTEGNALKRKMDSTSDSSETSVPVKRQTGEIGDPIVIDGDDDVVPNAASSNAANLYAKLAASLLEDEEEEEEEVTPPPPIIHQSIIQEPQKQVITVPVPLQRQIIVSPNNPPQIVLAPSQPQQLGQATATIKTETGYQTVPVILQHSAAANQLTTNYQIQKQIVPGGQQIIQPMIQQPQQTQYMLATNNQGQTYLVAQQAPAQHQAVLVTQSPQGAPTKTIIFLQQPGPSQSVQQSGQLITTPGTQQKVIMATQQGQQMIVTQVPRPVQHQIIMNHHPMSTTATIVQNNSSISTNAILNQTSSMLGATNQPQIVTQQQLQQQQQLALPPRSQTPVVQQQIITQQVSHQQTIQQQTIQHQTIHGQAIQQQQQLQLQQQHQQQQQQSIIVERKPIFVGLDSGESTIQPTQSVKTQPTPPPTKPLTPSPPPVVKSPKVEEELPDPNWLWICDWRGCSKKKFRSANDVYLHTCTVHCPDNIDPNAEIYCQWGPGPNLCDNLPRKRFSLMTHLFDRHCTTESFKAALQRRIAAGPQSNQPTAPVTIIKNPVAANNSTNNGENNGTASPALSTSSSGSLPAASAAMQAIKRHAMDFVNPREMMDENEGPVTKSIRLTAALILRNLVNYTTSAKRSLRFYEPHLAGVALSNVESSRTIAQVLYEMNEASTYPYS